MSQKMSWTTPYILPVLCTTEGLFPHTSVVIFTQTAGLFSENRPLSGKAEIHKHHDPQNDPIPSEYPEIMLFDVPHKKPDHCHRHHGFGIYPTDASGNPFTVTLIASTGDPIVDLNEDLAAEAKARAGYEHLMNLTDDAEILAPLSFLRQREIIHYQRFAEALKHYQDMFKQYQG